MSYPKSGLFRSLLAACAAAGIATASASAAAGRFPSGADAAAVHATLDHGVALVNGVRLHFVEGGTDAKGDPILLIPGWPQSWYAEP